MDPREKRMLDKEYEIKADIDRPKEVKEPTVAITPTGTQYVGNVMDHLRLHGFASVKAAREAGWRFK